MAILIYLAAGLAAFFIARKAGISRWLAIVLAWLLIKRSKARS